MLAIVYVIAPVFALIAAGYLCGRAKLFGDNATDVLNNFVVYLALPALLFRAMARSGFGDLAHGGFVVAFGGGMALTFALSFLLERGDRHPLADRSIEALAAGYPNTGYMGIPLCLAVFGDAGLPPAIVSAILTVCVLFAVAIALIELDIQAEPSLGRTLAKATLAVLRNPLVFSPLGGLAFSAFGVPLPGPIDGALDLLGASASPCALVTIGLFLAETPSGGHMRDLVRMVSLKLLVQPAITAVLAFGVFDLPRLWSHSAILLAALPTGTGPFMLAKLYEREPAATSRAILISTLLSVATISLLIAWLE
jgi:predicted permease